MEFQDLRRVDRTRVGGVVTGGGGGGGGELEGSKDVSESQVSTAVMEDAASDEEEEEEDEEENEGKSRHKGDGDNGRQTKVPMRPHNKAHSGGKALTK